MAAYYNLWRVVKQLNFIGESGKVCDLQDWSCLNELELNFYTECEGSHCFSIALMNESRSGIFQHVILQATKFLRHRLPKGLWLPSHNILCLVSKYRIM